MADKLSAYALCSVDHVIEEMGHATGSQINRPLIERSINGVTRAFERWCNRKFRSRQYVHDGVTLPLLGGSGLSTLWLASPPITAVSVLKPWKEDASIDQGADEDFTLNPWTGKITYLGGSFRKGDEVTAVTYTGGFLDDDTDDEYGYRAVAGDVEEAAIATVVDRLASRRRGHERVTSFSTDGGTYTLSDAALLPWVREVLMSYRILPV